MRNVKKVYLGLGGLLVAVGALVALNVTGTSSQAISQFRNCNPDAIVKCGATSEAELVEKFDANVGDVQNVFRHYGITRDDITGKTSTIKHGTVYLDGRVVVDGKEVASGAYSVSRVKFHDQARPVTINGTTYYEGPNMSVFTGAVDAYVLYKNGQFYKAILSSCANPLEATPPPVTPAPKPVFACESLKATKIESSDYAYKFDAVASAQDATIKSYTFNFGDGNTRTVTTSAKTVSVTHDYGKAGTYPAEVTVTMSDGKVARSESCKHTVTAKTPPVEDKPGIDIVKTVNGKEHDTVAVGTTFTYEITVRNTGNVALKNAVVTDRAPKEVSLLSAKLGKIENNTWTYTIPELKVGGSMKFVVEAKYEKYASGTHKNTVCVDTPTVPSKPGEPDDCDDATTETTEPIKVCDLTDNTVKVIERDAFDESHMTTDLSKCGEIKVCIIEDKTIKVIAKNEYDESTMTTDLSKCDEVPVTPVELPKTGMETFLSGSLGLGSITAAGYYWSASRRNLLDTLLKK